MKRNLIILAAALFLLMASYVYLPKHRYLSPTTDIRVGETELRVEVADTPRERSKGLSGQKSLKNGEGMLFVFDEPLLAGFWMKDMSFAIDIIWIDASGRVIGIDKEISPDSYPETVSPAEPVKYVLEVPAGFSDMALINVGEILSIGQ